MQLILLWHLQRAGGTASLLLTFRLQTVRQSISVVLGHCSSCPGKLSEVKVTQSCLTLCDPMDYTIHGIHVGNLISCSSAFSKTSLNIWKFTVHVLLKPGLENFKHYFTSVWDKCNCAVVLEKPMAPHSSPLAWKIPWAEEPGRLQSMGSLGVGHDWATSLSLFTFMHWRRKWKPTPVFLPGKSQGRGSLVGFRLWGRTESDTTEAT